eukprot:UN27249
MHDRETTIKILEQKTEDMQNQIDEKNVQLKKLREDRKGDQGLLSETETKMRDFKRLKTDHDEKSQLAEELDTKYKNCRKQLAESMEKLNFIDINLMI